MIKFIAEAVTVDAAAPDGTPRRTITAIAAPYGTFAAVADGQEIAFAPGSLPQDGPAPKVFLFHDPTKPIGIVSQRTDMGDAMMAQLKISQTQLGDESLALAADGVYQVSVGVTPTQFTHDAEGRMIIQAARWDEISLVPHAAFGEASSITKVAASAENTEMHEIEPETVHNENNDSKEEPAMEAINHEATPVEAAAPTAPIVFAQPRKAFTLPSAGEYFAAFAAGGSTFAEMQARVLAAAPDVTSADGALPEPILGPIYNNFRGLRPVIDASRVRAMPQSGKVFMRPVVTTHNTIAEQTNELDTLQASAFVITDVPVTKGTYGGYVSLSEQAIDWTSPEILGALLDDMSRVYANQTDTVACGVLETASNTQPLADNTDPADWVTFLYAAASDILTNSNGNLPDTLYLAPDTWAAAGALVDNAGRPLFPSVGPMNAFGAVDPGMYNGNAFGLRVVVDRNLTPGTVIVGNSEGLEPWELQKGAISIDAPSTLSRTIAWRGYFAALLIDNDKFVKMDNPA